MSDRYPWDNTTNNAASEDDPRYETPGGAQAKADQAEQDAKYYSDAKLALPELPIANGSIVERHIRDENISTRTIAQKAVTNAKIADDAIDRRTIQSGAVGSQELDPALLQNYGDIAVQAKFVEVDAQLADIAKSKHNVYNVRSYGVSATKTATENTAIIQNLLNTYSGKSYISTFVFDGSEDFSINSPIQAPNNTHIYIDRGSRVANVQGTNRPVFVSQYWYDTIATPSDLTKKSDYLGITGGGEINYNKFGTAPGGLNRHAVCIAGVKKLHIGDGIHVTGAFKYCWLIANIDYLVADELSFNNESDGLHLQPPIYHAHVRNLRGHTGDDMFAMTGGDYADYDIGTRGNFTFIDVEGLYNDDTLCAVKITGNTGVEFKHVSVKGIYGTCAHAPIRIWCDANLTNTKVVFASFKDIACIPGSGYALAEVYDRGYGTLVIDDLSIEGISTRLDILAKPVVDVKGSVDLIIYNLTVSLPRNIKFGLVTGDGTGNDNSRIFNATLTGKNTLLVNDAYSTAVLVTRGVIDNVCVLGSFEGKVSATLIQQRGGTLKNAKVDLNGQYKDGSIYKQYTENVDLSRPNIKVSGSYSALNKIAVFKNGGDVLGDGAILISTSSHQIESDLGIVNIYGDIHYGNSLIPASAVAGLYFRAFGFNLSVNAAVLQRTGDQFCKNTNASFATGTGLVAYKDGVGWKHLITDLIG